MINRTHSRSFLAFYLTAELKSIYSTLLVQLDLKSKSDHIYTVMFEHLMNDSGTSLLQQGEITDEDRTSAPASLFSVPSFGTDEWRNFRFNAMMGTSTTATSPISPGFPRIGSGSSTVGVTAPHIKQLVNADCYRGLPGPIRQHPFLRQVLKCLEVVAHCSSSRPRNSNWLNQIPQSRQNSYLKTPAWPNGRRIKR